MLGAHGIILQHPDGVEGHAADRMRAGQLRALELSICTCGEFLKFIACIASLIHKDMVPVARLTSD